MRAVCKALSLLLLAVLALATAPGCGGPAPGTEYDYRVEQSGEAIGSQSVTIDRSGGRVTYAGIERRPFLPLDTTVSRTVAVSGGPERAVVYRSTRQVPGAAYTDSLDSAGGRYSFFSDRLQTFDYARDVEAGGTVMPFEPDSACLAQALADRFFSTGERIAVAQVVVPSVSGALRQLRLELAGRRLRVTGVGVPDLELLFDREGVLESLAGAGMRIARGPAKGMSSRPYQPEVEARAVREVRVAVPERLASGRELELAGSLYLPRGDAPYRAVVLAPEEGPRDRTGGGMLSQFASALVARGMAVLACDVRGISESDGSFATHTFESAVTDLNAQVDYLSMRSDIDARHISILGYGEGGQVAAAVAARNPYVTALALAAAPAVRPWPDLALLRADAAAADGRLQPVEAAMARSVAANQLALLEKGGRYAELDGRRVFLGWMRSQAAREPLASMRSLDVPVLVVHGGGDELVPPDQAAAITRALADGPGEVETALFEGLGHGLGRELDEAEARPFRSHPVVSKEVLRKVAGWLAAR